MVLQEPARLLQHLFYYTRNRTLIQKSPTTREYIIFQVKVIAMGKSFGTVLYKTKSLDGTKPKTNPNPDTNPIQLFYAFSSTVP